VSVPEFLFGPPQAVTGEQKAAAEERRVAAEALEKQMADAQVQARRQLVFWASITCSCHRRYDWLDGHPPQHDCAVHGGVMIHYDTGEII
jgi:hypothetical protein